MVKWLNTLWGCSDIKPFQIGKEIVDEPANTGAVAAFEKMLKAWFPQGYASIPKPVVACLAVHRVMSNREGQEDRIMIMENVLRKLSQEEAYDLANGAQLPQKRCNEIAAQSALPISSVRDAIDQFRSFCNEGPRFEGKRSFKRKRET